MKPQQAMIGHVNHEKKAARVSVKPTGVDLDVVAGMKPDGGLDVIPSDHGGHTVHDPVACLGVAPFLLGCACLAVSTLTWKLFIM